MTTDPQTRHHSDIQEWIAQAKQLSREPGYWTRNRAVDAAPWRDELGLLRCHGTDALCLMVAHPDPKYRDCETRGCARCLPN